MISTMRRLPNEMLLTIMEYLPEHEKLRYSSTGKMISGAVNRKEWIRLNSARRSFPFFAPSTINPLLAQKDTIDDLKAMFFTGTVEQNVEEGIDCLRELIDVIFSEHHYPVYISHWMRYANHGVIVPIFASSQDINQLPIIYTDVWMNVTYRCKMKGRIRREIRKSLTLRALVG